ncbi:uncharacterized protein TNCV_829281 [Trichonephila clavipes]|nr:uncharacterized protein TNCV_829281 [Trichonephila clavipes]
MATQSFREEAPFEGPSVLKRPADRRKQLLESFNENNSLNDSQGGLRTEINQINAKIRKSYAQLKRSRWRELCKNLDSRTTNSKLWRIVKKINKEQEQCEESNSVIDTNGQVFPDDKAAANGLAVYYQETSKLVFTSEDKSVMKELRTSSMAVAPLMWVIRACPGTSHSKNFC